MLAFILLMPGSDVEKGASRVLAALTRAAKENHRAAEPRKGAALSAFLVAAASKEATKLPEKDRATAFLLALGIGFDRSSLIRSNFLTGAAWKRIEPDKARKERLAVLGVPTLHGREDLMQHFAVSAALTAYLDAKRAEAIGVLKEVLDSQPGGSGFSFADLAADFSGVAFAEWVKAKPSRLSPLGDLSSFCLPPKGLEEGLSATAFEKKYGGAKGKGFAEEVEKLRKRIAALPGFKE